MAQINVTWTTYGAPCAPDDDVLAALFGPRAERDDAATVRHVGVLTCDHAASSYGLPVVVMGDGTALGPADIDAPLGVGDPDVCADGEVTREWIALCDAARAAGFRLHAINGR